MRIRYQGLNSRAHFTAGSTTVDNLPTWVRAKHNAGWRELKVWRKGSSDDQIGGIARHPDTNNRTWWAEASDDRSKEPTSMSQRPAAPDHDRSLPALPYTRSPITVLVDEAAGLLAGTLATGKTSQAAAFDSYLKALIRRTRKTGIRWGWIGPASE